MTEERDEERDEEGVEASEGRRKVAAAKGTGRTRGHMGKVV